MAARLRQKHTEDIRTKIQSDRLISWLQSGIFDEAYQGKNIELTKVKVSAAIALLNKTLPNLAQTQLAGTGEDGAIHHRIEMVIVDAS